MAKHRFYDEAGGVATAVDGEPRYSVRFRARFSGTGQPLLRFDVYHFDDTNPTADPESTLLRVREFSQGLANDGEWHDVEFVPPAVVFGDAGSLEANSIMLYLGLEPPADGLSVLLVDDIQFMEWRIAEELPDTFFAVDAVRAQDGTALSVELERIGGE